MDNLLTLLNHQDNSKEGAWFFTGIVIHSKSEDCDPNYPAKKLNFPQICPKMPENFQKMAKNDPK